ncbi:MAG: GrpB family protein [Anaerotruncus sp.]|nr:MAG: GrpB family protein [Anaerotruncus sp.]
MGSTAVKSICAKPIIDIAVGVRSFDDIFAHNDELQKHGIAYRREDHPGQHLYVCADDKKIIFKRIIFILLFITAKIGIIM